MMFAYEAIRQGVQPRNLGYPCPETVAVFDEPAISLRTKKHSVNGKSIPQIEDLA